jgi:hypothetical protein
MIQIDIIRMEHSGIHCANSNCKHSPEHMINILGNVWYIKVDTTAARLAIKHNEEYYCRGCIDELYQMFKIKLDSKLWAFH